MHRTVISAYGVLDVDRNVAYRSTFVIDREGVIRYAHRAIAGLTFRPASELVEAVRAARRGSRG